MIYRYTMKGKPPSTRQKLIVYGVIIAIVAIVLIVNLSKDSDLKPVAEPRSGEILSGIEVYDGSIITITAPSRESCVVKLKTLSGVERLSFYVRAGDTVTVGVPCEYLQVYFASGSTWYGNKHLFGENTAYAKDVKALDFVKYTWEYTLRPVGDGNFSQTPIGEDEF